IFLGHVRFCPLLRLDETVTDWHQLQPRNGNERVTGEVKLSYRYERITKKHYGPEDFEKLRLIGKGKNIRRISFEARGWLTLQKVLLVRFTRYGRRTLAESTP